ncbi:hypothetical protein [Hymenobacter sp. B81]|uniref:hypothetical protein n=1 Tax=Hymenobacter sp. B81 TaxID=3344878 RepID=UPI0037DDD127
MKTPFRLDEHPRRARLLAPPPDQYFERLPLRVMQRVQAPDADPAAAFGWLRALSAPLRTALASVLLLLGFLGAFWLLPRPVATDAPLAAARPLPASQALARVPPAEVVQYLLADTGPTLALSDLAETAVADQDLTQSFLPGSAAEIQAALDEQPAVDVYL